MAMKLAGDRMMTVILNEMRKAGVHDVTLSRSLDVIAVTPTRSVVSFALPRMMRSGKKDRVQKARDGLNALLSDPTKVKVYAGRTFSEALAFRLQRFFSETNAEKLVLTPSRYEVSTSCPGENDL